MNFYEKVYQIVERIPSGSVMTYGQIAALAGNPRASRAVGYALRTSPSSRGLPCHRVLNRDGFLSGGKAFGSPEIQKFLLEQEGIAVSKDYRVDLKMYLFTGDEFLFCNS